MYELPSARNGYLAHHVALLTESYATWLGDELIDPSLSLEETARRLFEASFVVVSHGTQDDPIFNYGNRSALNLFEMDWQTFTQLPSRYSAEPMNRLERERLLTAVAKHNFIDDYAGVRITATGRRFHIPKAIVWNVIDRDGTYHGQAATFREWKFL